MISWGCATHWECIVPRFDSWRRKKPNFWSKTRMYESSRQHLSSWIAILSGKNSKEIIIDIFLCLLIEYCSIIEFMIPGSWEMSSNEAWRILDGMLPNFLMDFEYNA